MLPVLSRRAFVGALAAAGAGASAVVTGGGYFPVAIPLGGEEAGVVLRGGGAHLGRGGRLDFVASRDGGATWSAPRTIADGPEDDRNPAFGRLSDGDLLVGYAILSGYETNRRDFDGVYLTRSRDNGRTWSRPQRSAAIHAFYAGKGAVSPYGKIVQLADGAVLMAVYFQFGGERGNESWLFRSADGGRTWGDPSLLGRHFNETALAAFPGGRLVAAMRSQKGGHLAVIRSRDGGRTWTDPAVVTRDNEHPADLVALSSGGLLLTYGVRVAPMGVHARTSRD
ncbi:MAG: sialidase family protein, partial [Bryobacteraceae bacterium]